MFLVVFFIISDTIVVNYSDKKILIGHVGAKHISICCETQNWSKDRESPRTMIDLSYTYHINKTGTFMYLIPQFYPTIDS